MLTYPDSDTRAIYRREMPVVLSAVTAAALSGYAMAQENARDGISVLSSATV
jgi:hypothetical protein